MPDSPFIAVDPVHGWGWRTGDGELTLPPQPFRLKGALDQIAGGAEFSGLIKEPDHLLDGLWVRMAKRDKVWNGICTLVICRDRPTSMADRDAIFIGYASVDVGKAKAA